MNAREKMSAARLIVRERAPYFRAALLGLIPRELPGLDTFAVTEKLLLLWDPAAADRWTVEQIAAVLMHEIGHVLRDHAKRAKGMPEVQDSERGRFLWNLAGDAEINDDLEGWGLPEDPVMPAKFGCKNGLTAEEYYQEIKKQAQQQKGQGQPQAGDGKGKAGGKGQQPGKGEGAAPGDGAGAGKGKQPGKGGGAGDGDGLGKPGRGWCGSGAGRPVPGEPPTSPGTSGAKEGRSEVDVKRIQREVAESIREAAQRGRGSVPAGWQRWAEETLRPPVIPWQTKLQRAARAAVADKAGAVDYTYRRPSRRQVAVGLGKGFPVLPILRAPVPRVALALDASGSMGTEELTEALAEGAGVLKAVGAQVLFMVVDAALHVAKKVRNYQEMMASIQGGGGTDFRPVFEHLERSREKPDILVFLTDGDGPAPDHPPKNMLVIWVIVGNHGRVPAPWGQAIIVRDGKAEAA